MRAEGILPAGYAGSRPGAGEGVMVAAPELSVVVPSVNGWSELRGCLQALREQSGDPALEIIVADRVGDAVRVPLRRDYPEARLIAAAPGTTIPALRALAFREAHAEIVGVIEDHVVVPRDWSRRMLEAHREGHEVVGGSVENAARERLVDWAAFLCEYSHCLAPASGPAAWLTGNNVTYRRRLLERFREVIEREHWENELHEAMHGAGITLVSRPEIGVGHKKHYTAAEYAYQRYIYSRSFAGARLAGAGVLERLAYGLAAFALPPLLLYRIASRVRHAGRHRRELVRSLPLLGIFVTAWAAGEVMGYWFGPGNSLEKVC